jgi:hypothetical protein
LLSPVSAIVSTLGNVMGDAWSDDARAAGHYAEKAGNALESSQENASVPFALLRYFTEKE